MTKKLQLAPGLTFPLDAVTRAGVITGQRGTGKTTTAVVEVEEASAAGAPSVIIDPTDAWWGLRYGSDGKSAGLSHVVFGGDHGHLPLREEMGGVLARLVAEQRLACVLSLQHLRKGAQLRFVTEFLEELYHVNRDALLVVIDEAHRFAPAQLRDQERGGYGARCLGAVVDIGSLGRKNGLGIRMVTQRLARLHADIREACEIVIVHRLIGTNDRKAVEGWLRDASLDDEAAELGRKLPKLKRGEALVYAPDLEILGEFQIRAKRTFDSSGTPEVGASRVEPKGAADVDLVAIESQIGETLERAKAEDPKQLRRRIAELERDLKQRPTEKQVETVTETVKVPVLGDDEIERLTEAIDALAGVAGKIVATTNEVTGALGKLKSRPAAVPAPVQRPAPAPARAPARPTTRVEPVDTGDVVLKAGARRMLTALASLHPTWLTRAQVGTLAKVKHTGGTFGDYLSALRTAGAIEENGTGRTADLRITDRGFELLGTEAPAPATTEELLAMWRDRLKRGARAMLDALVEGYPDWLSREELADAAGIEVSGGTFGDYLSMLRRTGLIDEDGRQVRAAETLFLGATA